MKFHIWRPKKDGTVEVQEFEYEQPEQGSSKMPQFPHCDMTILHAPGECEYCDRHPDWQNLREWWRINFTGHHDDSKAPCPSTYFRSDETHDLWYGNVPKKHNE